MQTPREEIINSHKILDRKKEQAGDILAYPRRK
jgi:hypothetical protein